MGEDTADDFALVRLAGDDGEFARLAFTVGGLRQVEAQLGLTRVVIHAVTGETMLRKDRADFLVEVDGEEARGDDQKQADKGKATHGAKGCPGLG